MFNKGLEVRLVLATKNKSDCLTVIKLHTEIYKADIGKNVHTCTYKYTNENLQTSNKD